MPCAAADREQPRFGRVVENWYQIMSRTKRLTAFTTSYTQAAVIFPFVLAAPAYFAGKIQLGGLMQTAQAFGQVQKALSFFVSIYRSLAEWRAVVARLDGRHRADLRVLKELVGGFVYLFLLYFPTLPEQARDAAHLQATKRMADFVAFVSVSLKSGTSVLRPEDAEAMPDGVDTEEMPTTDEIQTTEAAA